MKQALISNQMKSSVRTSAGRPQPEPSRSCAQPEPSRSCARLSQVQQEQDLGACASGGVRHRQRRRWDIVGPGGRVPVDVFAGVRRAAWDGVQLKHARLLAVVSSADQLASRGSALRPRCILARCCDLARCHGRPSHVSAHAVLSDRLELVRPRMQHVSRRVSVDDDAARESSRV
jgi:hypothetical protein